MLPEKDDRPQAERFLEAARQIGVDETGERFEKLVPAVWDKPEGMS